MWLDVNGERRQTGNTRTMIFGVAQLVADVSRYMTLLPGDVITTGTPPGVGMGMKPAAVAEAGRRRDARHRRASASSASASSRSESAGSHREWGSSRDATPRR